MKYSKFIKFVDQIVTVENGINIFDFILCNGNVWLYLNNENGKCIGKFQNGEDRNFSEYCRFYLDNIYGTH